MKFTRSPRPDGKAEPYARRFGLGDAVAVVAKPIARVIDAVAGTDLAHCGGCEKRRRALNRIGTVKNIFRLDREESVRK